MFSVLIVTEKIEVLEFLSSNINKEINCRIIIKNRGAEIIDYITKELPDVIIVDINLDQTDGIQLFQKIKKKNLKIHKVLYSNKHENYIKIAAYESGVDDFITDKITSEVFRKKIKQIYERLNFNLNNELQYKSLIIDKAKFQILYENKKYILPKKQFLIYSLLCTRPGEIFTRDDIYKHVWETEMPDNNRTVDVHIRQIRKTLPQNNIITFRGIGYKVENLQ
tara:strand:+ start:17 stop:685 length:669 start_codon:yes stop_codon:yes gene_type:complete